MQITWHHQNGDNNKYKEIQRLIRRKITDAKKSGWQKNVRNWKSYVTNMLICLFTKQNEKICRIRNSTYIINADNKILSNPEEINGERKNYIQNLFTNNRTQTIKQQISNKESFPILKLEITYAIKNMKNGKVLGPDNIHSEIVKLLEHDNLGLLDNVYKTDKIPRERLTSIRPHP